MIFVIKFSSNPYWSFENNIKLTINIYIFKNEFYNKILICFKIDGFILINSCIIFQVIFSQISF
jgi:hypothetical protein